VNVALNRCTSSICVAHSDCVTGWLLAEVRKKYRSSDIVGLRTANCQYRLDSWLGDLKRPVTVLSKGDLLVPVTRVSCSGSVGVRHFTKLRLLGTGGAGSVYLVRKNDDGRLMAMKNLNKQRIFDTNKVQKAFDELNCHKTLSFPFLAKLRYAFQSNSQLHMVMDFCAGGDMFDLMQRKGRLSEKDASFYVSETILALEHLHSNNVMYRDLKPENVFLDIDGHVVLGDFGHTKMKMEAYDLATTVCGSAEYMSPEMLAGKGYCRAVDFYSLGVLIYELLVGHPPFQSEDQNQLTEKILNCSPKFPTSVSEPARDLIRALMEKDPCARLGYANGFEEIKEHKWFSRIDWSKALRRELHPPYLPDMHEAVGEACEDTTDESPMIMEELFESFTYVDETMSKQSRPRAKETVNSLSACSLNSLRCSILA